MRILRVAQKLYPDVKGGGPYHVHAMSRDQAAMGHDVTVLTVRADPELPHVEEREGYTVVRYDRIVSPLGNDISPELVQFLVSQSDFDVIHAHSHLYFSTNVAGLKRTLDSVPLVITNHGLYSQSAPKLAFDIYLRTLGRWTFNRADLLFCYTEADERRLRSIGVSSRIEVVPNGIDTNRFTPAGSTSDLIEREGQVLLFVGRLVRGKRPDMLIKAFAEVLEEYPDAELYLCGDGPLRQKLVSLSNELSLEDSVHFLGQIPYDEMPQVYRSSDVFVLPSQAEGMPRTLLEAQANGLQIVTSDLEQLESALTPNVITFDGDDTKSLVDSLVTGIKRTPGQTTMTAHSWDCTVQRSTELIERLAR